VQDVRGIQDDKGMILMGMFDSIYVFMRCPYCDHFSNIECQTKDLDNLGWDFHPLDKDWFRGKLEKKFRLKIPVFKQFPFDKGNKVWKNQAERSEAAARVPDKFKHLKFVRIIGDCHSRECQTWADERDIRCQGCPSGFGRGFYGKIRIKNGFLFEGVYDFKLFDKRLPNRRKRTRKNGFIRERKK
jgi:hypothetical protein